MRHAQAPHVLRFTHDVVEPSANAGYEKFSANDANVYLRNRCHERRLADTDSNEDTDEHGLRTQIRKSSVFSMFIRVQILFAGQCAGPTAVPMR